MILPRLLFAFLRRDALSHLSYRLQLALDILSILFSVATFHFVAKMFGRSEAMAAYGGDYFPFVLIGIAFSGFQSAGLYSLSQSIRAEQYLGTLESVLTTPVSLPVFLLASVQWNFLYATLEAGIYLGVGTLLFGAAFPSANFPAAFVMVALTLCAFLSIGVLSAAFIIKFKRGDPVAWLLVAASELLGGVFFPVAVLPQSLRSLSDFVPMTHALEGLRLALLNGADVSGVLPQAAALAAFTAVFVPLGAFVFRRALHSARLEGSLGHY